MKRQLKSESEKPGIMHYFFVAMLIIVFYLMLRDIFVVKITPITTTLYFLFYSGIGIFIIWVLFTHKETLPQKRVD